MAVCYSNPFRWRTRREIANDCIRHLQRLPNVQVHVAELAYGNRPFEIAGPDDLQFRTRSELFHKENLLNLCIQRFPSDWKYGAIVDADFHFTRHDWGLETIQQLQHYEWVQPFSSYSDVSGETILGHGHRVIGTNSSFVYSWAHGKTPIGSYGGRNVGAPGGAWAFRRNAFTAVGGLLDRCILGHGDWFMAFGLIGETAPYRWKSQFSPEYQAYLDAWHERAGYAIRGNVGYVDCYAIHHFHGPKNKRGYSSRNEILVDFQYKPYVDVFPDWQGVLQVYPEKSKFKDAIRKYFISRSEDVPHPVE